MKVGIYAGSFDPITNGHLDIIERAAKLVDKLIVAVLINKNKKTGLFTLEERTKILEEATKHIDNIEIDSFTGLLVDYAKSKETNLIVRGIRNSTDADMEVNLDQANKYLYPEIETILLVTKPEYAYISSSTVREIVSFSGDYKGLVPQAVIDALEAKTK